MRKDSEMFLKKILDYRNSTGKNNFELNYQYFDDIPSIETAVYDILDDLIINNCLTSKSQVIDLEGGISINLTLDGITYFDEEKERNSAVIFNVSGGQVNIAKNNGKIDAIMGNTEPQKERKKIDIPIDNVYQCNERTSGTGKKVFISYSWVPGSNKEWVRKLAQKLEQDGVEVVIDYKDLRLGHDKYAFMERIVADETIDKVLIICNKSYKHKADSRSGGVGDESAIITPQVYGNVRQEKFIPVVNEYNEDGKPYLPNYLASRMYADLTDFNMGYGELLSNILGEDKKDIVEKNDSKEDAGYDFEKIQEKIHNLLKRKEFESVKQIIENFEIYAKSEQEDFFCDLSLGKCYICIAEECKDKKKRRELLLNGLQCLEKAKKNYINQKDDDLYDLSLYYINACITLGQIEGESEYYKKGIEFYESDIVKDKIGSVDKVDKYRLLLDYALLLDRYSSYCNAIDAKKYLEKEYACYLVIGTIEELINVGMDVDSAYRFFVNYGRCCEQLMEISGEKFHELANNAIDLYINALDRELVTLRKTPEKYALVHNNLGNIYGRLAVIEKDISKFEQAALCYDKAMKVYKNIKSYSKYYECYSNKARLLSDEYKLFGGDEEFSNVESILLEIIKERIELENISGSYISKIQLAQLYTFAAEKNNDKQLAEKAIELYDEILEYFSEDYMPDNYYKVNYGNYKVKMLLLLIEKDIPQIINCIRDMLKYLKEKKDMLTNYVMLMYVELISETFIDVTPYITEGEAFSMYDTIKETLDVLGLEIGTFIEIQSLE